MEHLTIALEKADVMPPDRVTDNTSVLTLKNLMLEPLLGWDKGRATPALFSRWSHSADGRRWEFTIRPGAAFHDGKPCGTGDVIAVIEGVLGSLDTFGMPWPYARYFTGASIAAGTGGTVVIDTPKPFADILDIFSEFYISRPGANGRHTLGTGPYRVLDHGHGAEVTLERMAGAAGPERISLRAVPDAEERWRLLSSGAVDAAIHLDHMHEPPARDPRFRWGRQASPMTVMAYLNCRDGLFASAEARLAVNLAVDREALVRDVFRGLAVPASTIVSPAHLGMAGGLAPIPYDPGRARDLLAAAEGPRAVALRTPTHMPERAPEICRFVAESLATVGLDVTIATETDRPEYARQIGRKEIADMALFDSSPHSTFRVLNDKISSAVRGLWWQGFDDPETERLIAAANAAIAHEDREAAYAACLQRLRDHPPWLHLAHPVNLFAAQRDTPALHLTSKGTLALGAET